MAKLEEALEKEYGPLDCTAGSTDNQFTHIEFTNKVEEIHDNSDEAGGIGDS